MQFNFIYYNSNPTLFYPLKPPPRLAKAKAKILKEYGNQDHTITTYVVDITDYSKVEALVEAIQEDQAKIDMVVNFAGVGSTHAFDKVAVEEFNKVMDINFTGTFNVCRAFIGALKERDRASLVTVSSMEGLVAFPGNAAYVASKFAGTIYSRVV